MIIKKHANFIISITALITLHQTTHAVSDRALGLSFAASSIGLAVLNEEVADSETFEKIAKFINIDKYDLAPCLIFSSALWAASYIPEGNGRTVLRVGALIPILAAACLPKKAISKLAQLPGIKQYFALMKEAKGLPLIGDYAQCNQIECTGLCHKCKARKLYLTVPLAALPFVPTLYTSFKETIVRWEHERITNNWERLLNQNTQHLQRLNINREEMLTEQTVNRAYRRAAMRSHPDKNQNNPNANEEYRQVTEARDALLAILQTRAARERAEQEQTHTAQHAETQSPSATHID